ncbi:hypothetical protein MMEU_2474 [Mycobacterium marinum str. Europe]|nr:hypothetical protein MMEU_2474 [Mycobacterium marinum str. Europe]
MEQLWDTACRELSIAWATCVRNRETARTCGEICSVVQVNEGFLPWSCRRAAGLP